MNKTLFIDTSCSGRVKIGLELGSKRLTKVFEAGPGKAQMALPAVEELLKENNLKLCDLTEIKVNTGPGSFTGLRVGASIANVLGTLLKIPINGQPVGKPVFPLYQGSKYDTDNA